MNKFKNISNKTVLQRTARHIASTPLLSYPRGGGPPYLGLVSPRRDLGPVEVLWDGDGVTPPPPPCGQTD